MDSLQAFCLRIVYIEDEKHIEYFRTEVRSLDDEIERESDILLWIEVNEKIGLKPFDTLIRHSIFNNTNSIYLEDNLNKKYFLKYYENHSHLVRHYYKKIMNVIYENNKTVSEEKSYIRDFYSDHQLIGFQGICKKCFKEDNFRIHWVQCENCLRWYHVSCVNTQNISNRIFVRNFTCC